MFDLGHRTLRFRPGEAGYRIENVALEWDPEYAAELTDPGVRLRGFTFPYSGKNQDSFSVGVTGYIAFGGGVSIGRFDQLQDAARALINN